MTHLEPIYFGFPPNCCIKIIDIYSGGAIKPIEEISNLVQESLNLEDYNLEEGSYLRLKRAMKFILGGQEKMEGINLTFPNTIPAITPNPVRYTSATMGALCKK